MKKIIFPLLLMLLAANALFGQQPAPEILNYQGVARNSVGNVLNNKTISLKVTIRDGSPTGPAVYSETRTVTTNPFGLFNVQLGSTGFTSQTGTIAGVPWGAGLKYIQVETDPNGGSAFINIGTAQLASVPYALYASHAASSGDLILPYHRTQADAGTLFKLTNSGTGKGSTALEGLTNSTVDSASAIIGTVTSTAPGAFSAGVRGISNGTGGNGIGVWGSQDGSGWGVYGTAVSGTGIRGHSGTGTGGRFTTSSGLSLHTSGGLRFDGIGEGTNKILRSDASGNATWVDPLSLGIIGGSGTLNFVAKWTPNGTSLGDSKIFDNGTSVGINTTTPNAAHRLEVQGIQRINATTNQEGGELRFQEGNLFGTPSNWIIDNFLSFSGGNKFRIWNGAGTMAIQMMPTGRVAIGPMVFSDQPRSNLDIEGNMAVGADYSGTTAAPANGAIIQGNVGIGTNSPTAQLSVSEQFKVLSTGTVQYANGVNPMIIMFQSGTANADRMVIRHSTAAPSWGLQYQDVSDRFNFLSNGTPVLTADLAAQRVGVGTSAPSAKLHVMGNVNITDGTQGTGKVLMSDAAGNASWQDLITPNVGVGVRLLSGTTSFPAGLTSTVNTWLNIAHQNGGNNFNTATGEYTITVSGVYLINASMTFQSSLSGVISIQAAVNSILDNENAQEAVAAGQLVTTQLSYLRQLNSGDRITVRINNSTAADQLPITGSPANNFSVQLIRKQ